MLTLKDRLSHLSFRQACALLGPRGDKLIMAGGKFTIDIESQVRLDNERFQLDLDDAVVFITWEPGRNKSLSLHCSACSTACIHIGAALSLILEEKLALGLSAPPPEKVPVESLSNAELINQAIAERAERARTEKMLLESTNTKQLWTDYVITNQASGKSYRVALRGWERGESYCTCPDYRKNTLGTCKHIMFTINAMKKKFTTWAPYQVREVCIYLCYGEQLELRLLIPDWLDSSAAQLLTPFQNQRVDDVWKLLETIQELERHGIGVTIYPDAEEYLNRALYQERVKQKAAEIRKDPANHPLRTSLLKTDLRPYQLDGIAFAVESGRAILADDMGLGKTIQGVGVAEMLAQEANIAKVLVICPASVKSQWCAEIKRFSHRACQVVLGSASDRACQYNNGAFFTICNYEQVLRDILTIEKVSWDLIILDEGQRIKNWEALTSQTIKALKSPFAVMLTGTPLENRLEDLFSVVEFIDDRRLGPAFRFYNQHRVTTERGKVLGYKNLDELRKRLEPILRAARERWFWKNCPHAPRRSSKYRLPESRLICTIATRRSFRRLSTNPI